MQHMTLNWLNKCLIRDTEKTDMGYNNTYYSKALKLINENYEKKKSQYNHSLDNLYENVPLLYEIDRQLTKIGSGAAMMALSGDLESLNKIKENSQELLNQKNEILASAGIGNLKPECSICSDKGLVNGKYCDCVKTLAKKLILEDLSRVTPIKKCTFKDFNLNFYPDTPDSNGIIPQKVMTSVFKMAKDYCIHFPKNAKNLLFMGGAGLGKTHLSFAMAYDILDKGYGVVYGSAQNLFSEIEKEHFSYSGSTEKLDALLNSDLLVIDDLGTEFLSSFSQSLFYNIVNTRILNGKPTIINTNLSFKEIEDRYTPRISSRFIGNYEMIKFIGNDIRQQKSLQKN